LLGDRVVLFKKIKRSKGVFSPKTPRTPGGSIKFNHGSFKDFDRAGSLDFPETPGQDVTGGAPSGEVTDAGVELGETRGDEIKKKKKKKKKKKRFFIWGESDEEEKEANAAAARIQVNTLRLTGVPGA